MHRLPRLKLRQAIFDAAQPPAGATVNDLTIENGHVSIRGADRHQTIRELIDRTGHDFLEAQASTKASDEAKKYSTYSFGAQFAEVRVDADLGQIFVSRMVGAFDVGKILNAKTGRSQFIGGMIWGISMALHEMDAYDERTARIVNNNLAEYHVPTNADVGSIDVLWVEDTDTEVSPMGARGIGEIGITGGAAAIANAIYHATGKRVRDLPITPDKLL